MKRAILLFLSPLLYFQTVRIAWGAAPTVIQPFHVEGLGAPAVLRSIAERANITIGLEADIQYGKERQESLDFPGGTIAELAEKCAALLQGASWKVINGNRIVIARPSKAAKLAQVKINFAGVSNATRKEVWYGLLHQNELNRAVTSEGCKRLDLFLVMSGMAIKRQFQ